MRTLLLIFVATITGFILLATLAPIVALMLTLFLLYYGVKRFLLAESIGEKCLWAIVGLIGLSLSLSNGSAFVGIVAVVLLYYTYQSWKTSKRHTEKDYWVIE